MKIALCQMANAGKPAANLEKSIRAIKEAAENGADLILFPEVQLTEFFPQYPGQDVTQYRIPLDIRRLWRHFAGWRGKTGFWLCRIFCFTKTGRPTTQVC